MKRKGFVNFVYSFGEFAGWLIGAGLMIANIIKNSFDIGIIKGDAIFWIGLALVLLACFWRVFKADKKARDVEDKLKQEFYKQKSSSVQKFEVKSENQKDGITAGYIGKVNYPDIKKKRNSE